MQSRPSKSEISTPIVPSPTPSCVAASITTTTHDKKRPWCVINVDSERREDPEHPPPGKLPKMAIRYLLCHQPPLTDLHQRINSSACSALLTQAIERHSCSSGENAREVSPVNPCTQRIIEETSSEVSAEQLPASQGFQCDMCSKSFKERGNLTKHKRSVHTPRSAYFHCDVENCSKSFSFRDGLNRHKTTVHECIRAFECPYTQCDKRFKQRSHLRKHLRTVHKDMRMEPGMSSP